MLGRYGGLTDIGAPANADSGATERPRNLPKAMRLPAGATSRADIVIGRRQKLISLAIGSQRSTAGVNM